ncbi:MAG TPA: 50S ribosomal protein L23, partial [Candidatus Moranbacteria bacterium]|nr:50S ribosomal protein L23 [Candidatus Moranbacteria bacterium]
MRFFGRKKDSVKEEKGKKTDSSAVAVGGGEASSKKSSVSAKSEKKKGKKKVSLRESSFDHILLSPVITEKAYTLSEAGKYVFRVDPAATKRHIARAVADVYGVKVSKVNIITKSPRTVYFRG